MNFGEIIKDSGPLFGPIASFFGALFGGLVALKVANIREQSEDKRKHRQLLRDKLEQLARAVAVSRSYIVRLTHKSRNERIDLPTEVQDIKIISALYFNARLKEPAKVYIKALFEHAVVLDERSLDPKLADPKLLEPKVLEDTKADLKEQLSMFLRAIEAEANHI